MSTAAALPRPSPGELPALVILDPEMQRLHAEARELAAGRLPVLIAGETGVGKEHLAEVIHEGGPRAGRPFVRINCAAVSEGLFESELFGHERGAFTGGDREKPGLLEVAGRGTVFLDEVGELPPGSQAKLLRALGMGAVHRVGGLTARPIEARVVSATNRDLATAVERGEFRRELYHRLAGAVLSVPPLRVRPAEILPLAERFARDAAEELGRAPVALAPAACALLLAQPWRGNVRELRNAIERAVLLAPAGVIGPAQLAGALAHVPPGPALPAPAHGPSGPAPAVAAPATAGERRARVQQLLAACGGNQKQAARLLGVDRRTLSRWLDQLGLARPRKGAR